MSAPAALSKLTRRGFVRLSAATGASFVLGFYLPSVAGAEQEGGTPGKEAPRINPLNAWIRIDHDGTVTLIVAKSEMGQGVMTSLPMILADELEVDWSAVHVEQAATKPEIYTDLGTGGSGSVLDSYTPLRQAGAIARTMLIQAAAQIWRVDAITCYAKDGAVVHNPRGHRIPYGDLVNRAAKLPVPELSKITLKNPDNFRFIGTSIPRIDIPPKVDGSAKFGIDVRVPGMVYAVLARCPVFEGKVRKFDATKAKAIAGVREIVEIPAISDGAHTTGGIAVIADSTWAAMQGRDALEIEWDEGPHATENSAALSEQLQSLTAKPGKVVYKEGDADAALASANGHKLEAAYELPLLAHATMEPMNCTADVRADRAELWAPTQGPEWNLSMVSKVLGLKPQDVTIHTVLMGGAFGRRYQTDFAVEAAQVSKAVGKPVQVLWSREDDMQHDFYRPAFHHRLAATLDDRGRIIAWRHRLSSTPISPYWRAEADPAESEIGSAKALPYAITNFQIEYAPAQSSVPRAWWRSVENAPNAFAVESFIDELAAAAKIDPLDYRIRLFDARKPMSEKLWTDGPPLNVARMKATLKLAAQKGGWKTPAPEGRARGMACYYSFNTYAAHVAEVSVSPGGKYRVHKIVAAVDCGRAVDPDGVKAQIEGGIVYALSAVLTGEITFANGRIEQSNFNDYKVARMRDMPEVEVYIVPSDSAPTGVGEPGLPPLAPAITNAIFAASGKRVRRLPIRSEDLT
jgi:isoquinoline 1-oxidoreductase subunit beta